MMHSDEIFIFYFFIIALISIAAAIAKIAYPASRGWMAPFRKGLVQNVALCNHGVGIWHLFKAVGPLLLGTILEYGEWNLLTLFVRHLGTAEGMFFLRSNVRPSFETYLIAFL